MGEPPLPGAAAEPISAPGESARLGETFPVVLPGTFLGITDLMVSTVEVRVIVNIHAGVLKKR